MSHSVSHTDTVSVSAAEEDAAMTLLNARNFFMSSHSGEQKNRRAGSSGESSRSKRVPKPAKHKNDFSAPEAVPQVHRKRTPTSNQRKGKDVKWMERHLENMVIGKSAVEPPEMDILVKHEDSCRSMHNQGLLRQGYFQVIDMSQLSQQQLLTMSESTQNPTCMPPVLQPQAGVKEDKVASFSGQDAFYKATAQAPRESRKKSTTANYTPLSLGTDEDKANLAHRIQQIWKHDNNHVWRIVGKSEPPVVNRVQINYLRLFLVVEDFGGYDYALENKRWSDIARKFGMEESNIGKNGHSLRMLYLQFIKPIREYLDHQE